MKTNMKFMRNTREVINIMFTADRVQMSDEDIVQILQNHINNANQ